MVRLLSVLVLAAMACATLHTADTLPAEDRSVERVFTDICGRCHGRRGTLRALGASAVIADWPAAGIAAALRDFRERPLRPDDSHARAVMRRQALALLESEIDPLAQYVAGLKETP